MCPSYNKYLSIAARVVRRSLKDDKRLAAEKRGVSELRFAKWTVSASGVREDMIEGDGELMC